MKVPTFLQKARASSTKPSTTTSSTSDLEKVPGEAGTVSPVIPSGAIHDGAPEKVFEETAVEEAAALDKLSEEPEYPKGAKLAIITAALCLSVFLMALVRSL